MEINKGIAEELLQQFPLWYGRAVFANLLMVPR